MFGQAGGKLQGLWSQGPDIGMLLLTEWFSAKIFGFPQWSAIFSENLRLPNQNDNFLKKP